APRRARSSRAACTSGSARGSGRRTWWRRLDAPGARAVAGGPTWVHWIMPNPAWLRSLPLLALLAPLLHRVRQRAQDLRRVLPAQAAVGDALAEPERLARLDLLPALDQVRPERH